MKLLWSIIGLSFSTIIRAQSMDSSRRTPVLDDHVILRSEILSGGFIDIAQNGQMNASALLFRLYIGEPGKFQLPLSVYTGVSANNFSNDPVNDDILHSLINPGTGIFNMSFDGNNRAIGGRRRFTALHFQYQSGLRFLSVYSRINFANTTFFNLISGAGLILLTGAWEKNKAGNLGVFWLSVKALYSKNPPTVLADFFTKPISSNIFALATGMGIEISQTLNVKVFYFRFLNNRRISAFQQPLLQLSLNYSIR